MKANKKTNINSFNLYLKLLISLIFVFFILNIIKMTNTINSSKTFFDENFKYENYQREMVSEKMRNLSKWQMRSKQIYFVNGIIRKFRPKKCLEVGVAYGGSSILILNAIKDIKDSFLISLDLNTDYYFNPKYKTGYIVNETFPELTTKWKLYTGEQPHIFLDKLKIKFDFLLLDTAHLAPGEIINIIEILPFLEENAVIVLHDIMYHLPSNGYYKTKEIKFHPSNIYVMTSLYGKKIIIPKKNKKFENIGGIILYPNQERYYLNYFILLLSPWEFMPSHKHIKELRIFIKKYYKKKIYIDLFNRAVIENKLYVNNFKNLSKKIILKYK